MDGLAPNEIIHQSLRLRIMAALAALPEGESIAFARLRKLLGATDGNLGTHLGTLENAGYVSLDKGFAARKPQTSVMLTPSGRAAFAAHVAYLRTLIGPAA